MELDFINEEMLSGLDKRRVMKKRVPTKSQPGPIFDRSRFKRVFEKYDV